MLRKRNARLPLGERGGEEKKRTPGIFSLRNGHYLTRCRVIQCKWTKEYAGFVSTWGIYAVEERGTMLGKKPLKVEEYWLFGDDPRKFERGIGLKKPLKVETRENPYLQMIRETGWLEMWLCDKDGTRAFEAFLEEREYCTRDYFSAGWMKITIPKAKIQREEHSIPSN